MAKGKMILIDDENKQHEFVVESISDHIYIENDDMKWTYELVTYESKVVEEISTDEPEEEPEEFIWGGDDDERMWGYDGDAL